ncbi:caspase family protein [Nostoc spongiaeforme FACHB-130]|uniref:Caspase family protein n=1 Tax=Nostoc spongiaeforme FACHB-130 TaxID=1357510 RepID=A0ABR8G1S1_9NOSO|nr:caspase family protein [Nostoc spongiaeforme FACHB-130]
MAKFALLIGVSEYQPGLNALPGAVQDVKAMQRVLQHSEMGDFADADMTVLENPPRQLMERAIENLFSNRQKDDLVLFYFSGHGIKDDSGKLYLATSETSKHQSGELIQTTATAASLIHGMMEKSRSRRQVIILDCCFSGAFAEGMKAKDDNSVDIKNQLGGEGRAVLTSSTSTQYSFEQPGSDLSVYTRYIVEGIEKGAADTDNDGMISVDELHEYARKKVQEAAPAMKPEIYAVREGFKIKLAKAPVGDPQLEYRKEVERCVRNGNVSVIGRRILKRRQSELGLSAEVATQIENEVLEPYRQYQANLREYEEALAEAIQHEGTLTQHTREELKRFQQLLQLRDEDIDLIEVPVAIEQDTIKQSEYPQQKSAETLIPKEVKNQLVDITSTEIKLAEQTECKDEGLFERFTLNAIKVIMLAQEEARRLGHNFVGTEQILLGLIGDGTGVAAQVLQLEGMKLADTRIEVEKIIGRGSGFVAKEVPFTPLAKRVLDLSLEEAKALKHNYISTGDLLLGCIRLEEGVAVRVLEILGINLQNLREQVVHTINLSKSKNIEST